MGKYDKEDYDFIFDNGDDAGFDYSDPDIGEAEMEDAIEEIRGTIARGDCCLCGAPNAMVYYGDYFYCDKCKEAVDENLFYRDFLGENLHFDEEDDF